MQFESIREILTKAILHFNLNLTGTRVLTEAATGHFFVTPIIAALSGAEVIAIAKDSVHGKADDAISWVKNQAQKFGVEKSIHYTKNLADHDINKAHIITNLGFVRPLNKKFLQNLNKKAVISLFCESWEVRKEDIDLKYCLDNFIPVLGTNEEANSLNVFSNVGPLILKMISETSLNVNHNVFLIISGDKFGKVITETLNKDGARTKLLDPRTANLSAIDLSEIDAIIIADYTFHGKIIADGGILRPDNLKKYPALQVIHLAGIVDSQLLKKYEIKCYPVKDGHSFKMSETFSFLGLQPVVDLHTAGLKVGQELFNAAQNHSNFDSIIKKALQNPLCQAIQ